MSSLVILSQNCWAKKKQIQWTVRHAMVFMFSRVDFEIVCRRNKYTWQAAHRASKTENIWICHLDLGKADFPCLVGDKEICAEMLVPRLTDRVNYIGFRINSGKFINLVWWKGQRTTCACCVCHWKELRTAGPELFCGLTQKIGSNVPFHLWMHRWTLPKAKLDFRTE